MRVIIAGGRDFSDYDKLRRTVTHLLSRQVEVVVVCGEARGADSLGKKLATEIGWGVQSFHADWQKNGKSAGYKRNEELLPFYKLTEEERCILEREVCKGNVERLDVHYREWYQNITHLYSFSIYRTISQEEQEIQHEENNEFPWHMVSSEWNAVARDDTSHNWYLYEQNPLRGGASWCGEVWVEFDEAIAKVIGVDMSKWSDIPWEDSLMLRPGYEKQDTVVDTPSDKKYPVLNTDSDHAAAIARLSELMDKGPAVGSVDETELKQLATLIQSYEQTKFPSNNTKEYPVVKLKNLHKLSVGDIVRLKKTGELIEVGEYSEIGCSGCKFSAYETYQHPCRECGFMEDAYVDYKPPTETQDETFANTEMKEYADLDSKTKEFLSTKWKEGKVEYLYTIEQPITWRKKNNDDFLSDSIYRVV